MARAPGIGDIVGGMQEGVILPPTLEENAAATRQLVEQMARRLGELEERTAKIETGVSEANEKLSTLFRSVAFGATGRSLSNLVEAIFVKVGAR